MEVLTGSGEAMKQAGLRLDRVGTAVHEADAVWDSPIAAAREVPTGSGEAMKQRMHALPGASSPLDSACQVPMRSRHRWRLELAALEPPGKCSPAVEEAMVQVGRSGDPQIA